MRFRRLRTRIIVFFVGLIALVQAASFLAASATMTRNARATIQDELAVGGKVFARLIGTRTRHLAEAARLLSGDFAFKTAASSDDRGTVLSVLGNHQARIGADVTMLASTDAALVADTLHPASPGAPFPFPRLIATAEQAGEASAIVFIDGRAYQMVAVPLLAPLPIAWICVGFVIDDRVARDLQTLTLLHVSFLAAPAGGRVTTLASTLPARAREALGTGLPTAATGGETSTSVRVGRDEYVTRIVPLGGPDGTAIVAALQRSLAEALRPVRRLQLALLAIASAGLLVSLASGVLIAGHVTRPVRRLVESARRVARGDYDHAVTVTQGDEIGELATTFNHMTQGLAERDRVRAELDRTSRLKRFFSPQVAELIVSSGDESVLDSHRREITVVFCDVRGFTAFGERAEPEEVMGFLRDYHEAVGALVFRFEGTIEHFAGDGMMVFFNDPVPCRDHAERAVRLAVAMREAVAALLARWQRRGHPLGFGVGLAMGHATLGKIGFAGRFDYAAIGSVANLASRLCDEARDGQILVSQAVLAAVGNLVEAEPLGALALKGFAQPVPVFNVLKLQEPAAP